MRREEVLLFLCFPKWKNAREKKNSTNFVRNVTKLTLKNQLKNRNELGGRSYTRHLIKLKCNLIKNGSKRNKQNPY